MTWRIRISGTELCLLADAMRKSFTGCSRQSRPHRRLAVLSAEKKLADTLERRDAADEDQPELRRARQRERWLQLDRMPNGKRHAPKLVRGLPVSRWGRGRGKRLAQAVCRFSATRLCRLTAFCEHQDSPISARPGVHPLLRFWSKWRTLVLPSEHSYRSSPEADTHCIRW